MAGGIIGSLMYKVGFKLDRRQLDEADTKVGKLTKGVVGLGAAAEVAMISIGAAGIHAASEFEKAMSQVQSATGAATDQMLATREAAKNLYTQGLGEDWQDLGSAISTVQQVTGQVGAVLEKTTQQALILRDTFGFEVNESIKSVDTMMRQFGISSSEAMNLLTQGAQQGLDKSGELLDTANEYANQFKSLGFSAEDMFNVFGTASKKGVFQLDKVGDAVKEFNIRAKDGSSTTIQAFKMLGLDADKMMHTFAAGGPAAQKAFTDIMQMIGDIEDPVAKNTIGVSLLGSQFEDLEATVISAMGYTKTQFDKSKDSLAEINTIRFNKPGEAFKMFGRMIEVGILIPIGEKLLPYLNQFGQWLTEHKPQIEAVGNAIGDYLGVAIDGLITGMQILWPIIETIANQVGAVTSAATGWEGFLPLVFGITAAVGAYATVVGITTLATNAMTIATKAMALGTKIMTAYQYALNMAMSLNPIGLVIAAIVGLGVALVVAYKKSETFRNIVDKAWNWIRSVTIGTFTAMKDWIVDSITEVGDFFKKYWPYALGALTGPIGLLVVFVIKHWDQIKTATSSAFNSVIDTIKSIWNNVMDFLRGINLVEIGKNIIHGLIDGIASMKDAVFDKVKDIAGGIKDSITGFLGIHSPSRVMMEVGFYTGKGLAEGIEGTKHMVETSSTDLAREAVIQPAQAAAYSPGNAPARTQTTSKHEINVRLDLNGSGGMQGAKIDPNLAAAIRAIFGDELQSVVRRLGLEVEYG